MFFLSFARISFPFLRISRSGLVLPVFHIYIGRWLRMLEAWSIPICMVCLVTQYPVFDSPSLPFSVRPLSLCFFRTPNKTYIW
jgi:hypothetical protein